MLCAAKLKTAYWRTNQRTSPMKLSPGLNDPQEACSSEGAPREQTAALTAERKPGKTGEHGAPRPGASAAGGPGSPGSGPQPWVPPLSPPSVRSPSPIPGPRAAPLLRPMVHSGFLRRTCGSPSSAPRRRSRPQGCCCGGCCSPSAGGSIGLASDATRKRRGRPIARGGGGRLPSPRASGPQRLRRAATGRARPHASSRVPPRAEPGTGRPPRPLSTDIAQPSADPGGGASGVRALRLAGGGVPRAPRLEWGRERPSRAAREGGGACADARLRARAPSSVLAGTTVSSGIPKAAAVGSMFSPGKRDGATRGLGTDANSESRVGSAQVHVKFAIPTDSQEKVGVAFKLKVHFYPIAIAPHATASIVISSQSYPLLRFNAGKNNSFLLSQEPFILLYRTRKLLQITKYLNITSPGWILGIR